MLRSTKSEAANGVCGALPALRAKGSVRKGPKVRGVEEKEAVRCAKR